MRPNRVLWACTIVTLLAACAPPDAEPTEPAATAAPDPDAATATEPAAPPEPPAAHAVERSFVPLSRVNPDADPEVPRQYSNGRLTFIHETEGMAGRRVLFARGRMVPQPCAIAQD
jgi:hypothetical protein